MQVLYEFLSLAIGWSNENSGFVSVLLFFTALVLGWISGIFKAILRRPLLRIENLGGPSLVATFPTGREHGGYKTHRTAISIYLRITNLGSASTDIIEVNVGYHNRTFKHTFLWFWDSHQVNSLSEFKIKIKDHYKVYPFLVQSNSVFPTKNDTYLEIGRAVVGVVYFEQDESWGAFLPKEANGQVRVRIRVKDAFGGYHYRTTKIPKVDLEVARRYNSEFGNSIESMRIENNPDWWDQQPD